MAFASFRARAILFCSFFSSALNKGSVVKAKNGERTNNQSRRRRRLENDSLSLFTDFVSSFFSFSHHQQNKA